MRLLPLAKLGVEQHDADAGAVLGAHEHAPTFALRQRVARAHAQVRAGALQLLLDRLAVEPGFGRGGDTVGAKRVQHGAVVGVARREQEQVGGDAEAGQARVVDRAAELVRTRRSGERGAGLVEHSRQPGGVALELRVERNRRLRGGVVAPAAPRHCCAGGPISG